MTDERLLYGSSFASPVLALLDRPAGALGLLVLSRARPPLLEVGARYRGGPGVRVPLPA